MYSDKKHAYDEKAVQENMRKKNGMNSPSVGVHADCPGSRMQRIQHSQESALSAPMQAESQLTQWPCTDFFGQQIVFGFLVWHNYSFLSSNRHKKYRLLVQTVYREDSRIKRRKREPLLYGMKFRKTSGLSSTEVSLAERTIPPFRSGIEVRP